jgi:cytochrome P450 / NADPH-cytochrome P450 reductase
VVENRELQKAAGSGRSTRHIEIELPNVLRYEAGDHLAVYGGNNSQVR